MGYAGGTKKNPTYYNLGDNSETVQMDFDASKISFDQLLNIFWESHDPRNPSFSRQYMSIIFYHNERQRDIAFQSKEIRQQSSRRKIYTEIMPYAVFSLAESYHHKYYLRGVHELMKEFDTMYASERDFINSTAAARTNGYIAGYGRLSQLEREIGTLGLSKAGQKRLLEMVKTRDRELVKS